MTFPNLRSEHTIRRIHAAYNLLGFSALISYPKMSSIQTVWFKIKPLMGKLSLNSRNKILNHEYDKLRDVV